MRFRHLALGTLALGLLLSSCSPGVELPPAAPPAPRSTPSAPLELTILHTNDTWGYLLPCG